MALPLGSWPLLQRDRRLTRHNHSESLGLGWRLFTAYYDASGTERDQGTTLTVAGLVAPNQTWRRFEKAWKKVLGRIPHYRSVNFVHSRPPFDGWGNDETRREAFFGELVRVMIHYIPMAMTTQVGVSDFANVDRTYHLREKIGSPYPVGIGTCSRLVEQWVTKAHPGWPVRHIAESGDTGQVAMAVAGEISGTVIHLVPKVAVSGEWLIPYQAADLYAYTGRISADRPPQGSPLERKTALMFRAFASLGKIPHKHKYHDGSSLERLCKHNPEWFPER